MNSIRNNYKNKAFVLLFSLLISSILLATGLGISRLMVRQITLASLSRESQVAFFAADSGLECALHWNILGKFDPSTPVGSKSQTIYCNGATIADANVSVPAGVTDASNVKCDEFNPPSKNIINGGSESCFTFSLPRSGACAFVYIDKKDSTGKVTKITSNGYNNCSLAAPNILQRTLQITLLNSASQ